MARPQKDYPNKPVHTRLTPSLRAALEVYAERSGVDISTAMRTAIAWALQNMGAQDYDMLDVMRQNARAEWSERVNAGWRRAMEALTGLGLQD